MEEIGKALSPHFNILLVDLPGFGKSKSVGIEYTIDDIADAIENVLQECKLPVVHLLGYSMGGRVASVFLHRHGHRVLKVILESTSLGINDAKKRCARIQIDENRASKIETDFEAFVSEWEQLPLFNSQHLITEKEFKKQRAMRLSENPLEVADSLKKYGTGVQQSYWKVMNNNHPVLILVGSKDEKFVQIGNQMNKVFKNSKFRVIKNVGHNIHLENSVEFIRVVKKFLLEGL